MGLDEVRQQPGGASFACGGLGAAYRACLWSRTGTRVLFPLTSFPAETREQVYEGVRRVDWDDHLSPGATLACDVTGTSPAIADTHFGAQLVKDAVVDQLRERHGRRPSVDLRRPSVRLALHLSRGQRHAERGPRRREPAPARLPRGRQAGRGAAEGDAGGGHPAGRRLAPPGLRGRRPGRPALRLRHVPARGRLHGRRHGARPAARVLGLRRLARPRRTRRGSGCWTRRASGAAAASRACARRRPPAPSSSPAPTATRAPFAWRRPRRSEPACATSSASSGGSWGRRLPARPHRRAMPAVRADTGRAGLVVANPPYGERLRDPHLGQIYRALGRDAGRRLRFLASRRPRS